MEAVGEGLAHAALGLDLDHFVEDLGESALQRGGRESGGQFNLRMSERLGVLARSRLFE